MALAKILQLQWPLAGTGVVTITVSGTFSATGWNLKYDLTGSALTLNEPSGRYASELLGLRLQGTAQARGDTVSTAATLNLNAGQAYVEPIFADLGTHPLRLNFDLRWLQKTQQLELTRLAWDQPGVTQGSGSVLAHLGATPAVHTAALTLESGTLPAFAQIYAQPFLAGTRAEGLTGRGTLAGSLRIEGGHVRQAELTLDDVALQAPRLDTDLQGIRGAIHWSVAAGKPSLLSWTTGHVQHVPIGATQLAFLAQGRDFTLLKPWRQPILDGALNTQQLKLTDVGLAGMGADFKADIEPIDLAALCEALGWPKFSGKLSGTLPGLTLRGGVVALDGKLEAKAFDGDISVTGLQLIEPLGVLPRLVATVRLRNLDLAQLTGAFSFGRIEGRIDGDINNLRLLAWQPVAFKARLFTPPDDDSRHRISQRAIDNISSIGGGPRGVLSRGILSVFDDFNYARIGWSCVLDNDVCLMDGVEPAGDGAGYVLVKGRGLPRINVVGYSRRVRWSQLVQQIEAVRTAEPATTTPQ